jgi:2-iminobutanoate/2-iminopropanoate deaminase
MQSRNIFHTDKAPKPKGPYSQAVIHNGLLYLSGQIPIDPETGILVKGGIEQETKTVLNNIRIIIEEAGAQMKDVLKVNCYLANLDDFESFNMAYKEFFSEDPPARTTFQVARLPLGVRIEIDAIAALKSS